VKTIVVRILMVVGLSGCHRELDKVVLSPKTVALKELDATEGLKVSLFDTSGKVMEGIPVTYKSADPEVATVDDRGWLKAKRGGTTTITAAVGGKSDTASVDVSFPTKMFVEGGGQRIKGLPSNGEARAIRDEIKVPGIGGQITLKGTLADDVDRPLGPAALVVSVADPAQVTLEKDGVTLTAHAYGKTIVTAVHDGYTAAFFVRVDPPSTMSITAPRALSLRAGQTQSLGARLTGVPPSAVTPGLITFESSDPGIANVDRDGKVTGGKAGKARLTLRAGEATSVVDVSVTGGAKSR
jgi:hypothetical protein